jgi:hypothetical protein
MKNSEIKLSPEQITILESYYKNDPKEYDFVLNRIQHHIFKTPLEPVPELIYFKNKTAEL